MSDKPLMWHTKPERGGELGLRFMILFYKICGRTLTRFLLYPIVGYFFLADTKARTQSLFYLRRLYQFAGERSALKEKPGMVDVFKHIYQFGLAIVDRVDIWQNATEDSKIIWHGAEPFDTLKAGAGAVLLSAHIGSLDKLRAYAMDGPPRKIRALMYTQNAQAFKKVMNIVNPKTLDDVFPIDNISSQSILELRSYIAQGDMIAILGDRTAAGSQDRVVEVSFLGHPAPLPQGPLILASLLECPVFILFCVRNAEGIYEVFIEPFSEQIILQRKHREQQIKEWLTRYTEKLEEICCRFPYQWFNFYDFWSLTQKEK